MSTSKMSLKQYLVANKNKSVVSIKKSSVWCDLDSSSVKILIIIQSLILLIFGAIIFYADTIKLHINYKYMNLLHQDLSYLDVNSSSSEINHDIDGEDREDILMTNKTELIGAIQEIENSIYLDRIDKYPNYNQHSIYSTGLSPHYYDGEFSFKKTCKLMRFRYFCRPYIIEKNKFNEWTMLLHSIDDYNNTMSNNAKYILSMLQQQYDFYNHNIYYRLQQNINKAKKIFIKGNMNILFYGNSHLKQTLLGLLCILMDINGNNTIIKYKPTIKYINDRMRHKQFNFHETFCLDANMESIKEVNMRQQNALRLNHSMINEIYQTQFLDHDIQVCSTEFLEIEMMNNVNIYYIFANKGIKSIFNQTLELKREHNLTTLNITNFDIILFNLGNSPPLNMDLNVLEYDLIHLNHTKKPIIFHRAWYEMYFRYLIHLKNQEFIVDLDKVNKLRNKFPYLIYISTYWRYHRLVSLDLFSKMKETQTYGHFCNPGLPDHYALSLLHLINVMTTL